MVVFPTPEGPEITMSWPDIFPSFDVLDLFLEAVHLDLDLQEVAAHIRAERLGCHGP